jgi:transposase
MATRPTEEYRTEAVRVALTSGLPRKQVASDFGIGFSTLNRWIQQDRRSPEKPAAQSDLEREVAELRKENRLLREERDVLKKGETIFRHWSEDNGRTCSSRREANEVCLRRRTPTRHPGGTPVRDHGGQPAWLSGLAKPPRQRHPAHGSGRAGPHPGPVPAVSWQLRPTADDRRIEGAGAGCRPPPRWPPDEGASLCPPLVRGQWRAA